MPPLVLDDEEAVALAVGLQAAAQSGVAGIAEASVRALAKVVQVMPPRLRRRVEALRTATVPAAWGPGARRRPGGAHHRRAGLPRRRAARVRLHRCRRHAHGAARRAAQARVPREAVVPRRVRPQRHGWRSFRMDRLQTPRATGARFRPRELPADDAARTSARASRTRRGTTRSRRWSRRRRPPSASGSAGGARRGGRRRAPACG